MYIVGVEQNLLVMFPNFAFAYVFMDDLITNMRIKGVPQPIAEGLPYILKQVPVVGGQWLNCTINFQTADNLAKRLGIRISEDALLMPATEHAEITKAIHWVFLESAAKNAIFGPGDIIEFCRASYGEPWRKAHLN